MHPNIRKTPNIIKLLTILCLISLFLLSVIVQFLFVICYRAVSFCYLFSCYKRKVSMSPALGAENPLHMKGKATILDYLKIL